MDGSQRKSNSVSVLQFGDCHGSTKPTGGVMLRKSGGNKENLLSCEKCWLCFSWLLKRFDGKGTLIAPCLSHFSILIPPVLRLILCEALQTILRFLTYTFHAHSYKRLCGSSGDHLPSHLDSKLHLITIGWAIAMCSAVSPGWCMEDRP